MNPTHRGAAIAAASIAVVAAVIFVAFGPSLLSGPVRPSVTALAIDSAVGLGTVPMAEINGTARWYSYNSTGGTEVRIFVVRDANGGTRAAFDACDVCYGAKKGYVQRGKDMVCGNCGMKFPVSAIGDLNSVGGCWPSYLGFTLGDGVIEFQLADLEAKAWMFE
jgi:uncharacterized membrane protein